MSTGSLKKMGSNAESSCLRDRMAPQVDAGGKAAANRGGSCPQNEAALPEASMGCRPGRKPVIAPFWPRHGASPSGLGGFVASLSVLIARPSPA